MASASINGIRMNLGLEIDGDIDLDGEITDLIDGANQLDDGAKELYDGAVELNGGVNELNQGIKELSDGIGMAQEGLTELSGKASELTGGSDQIKNGLLTLQSALCDADGDASAIGGLIETSGQIKAGINSLCGGISQLKGKLSFSSYKSTMKANGLDLDQLKAGNELAVQQLSAQITELEATLAQIGNVPGYEEQAAQLSAQIEQLEGIVQLLTGSCAMIDGTGVYFGGLYQAASQLQTGADSLSTSYKEFDSAVNVLADSLTQTAARISALSDGINTLVTEYEKLDSGIKEYTHGVQTLCEGMEKIGEGADELVEGGKTLADGTAELADGIKELADGTGELQDKTSSIDSDKTQELTDMLETLTEEHQVTSFVSDKNTDVASVQFVISTKAIEIPQEEAEPEEAEAELNFWQKLLRLFGIN